MEPRAQAADRDLIVDDQVTVGGLSGAGEPPPAETADQQVVVGDVPMEPSCFQSRAGLLAELDRASGEVSVIYPVTGLRGVGVTELAAGYARAKLAAGWRLVAWVNGADTSNLLAGFAAVADATGLADSDHGLGIADAGAAVRRALEIDGDRCLLVFDDVSDPEIVRPFVPAGGAARVLMICNRQPVASFGSLVPVDVFAADEALAFLAARTGRDDEAGAVEAATALGHLPLALALAAPVIAGQQRGGYAWYLSRLQASPADVSLPGNDGELYPPSLAQAVLLSLQAVRAADRTGICTRLMEIMAGLAPTGVHRELLYSAGHAGVLANGGRLVPADLVDRVLEWLSGRSLLTFSLDGQTVVMHRLVARVIRHGLAGTGRLTAAYEAAAFVLDVYSRALEGSPDRRAVRGILQQVTALLDSMTELGTEINEELAPVLLRLRFVAFYYMIELGDSGPQAIAVGEPLAEDLERLLGADHPDTLNSRNSLAAAYLAAGQVSAAIPLFEQILALRQRMLGPDDPETLISQNNLASAYQDAGRTAEAIRLYERNLEVRERLLGPDHPSTLNSRGNLAAAYRDGGRGTDAIPLLEQALADRERVLGPDHPDTQTTRKKLAAAYQDEGRDAEAASLLEQASTGQKRILRPDPPGTQVVQENFLEAGRAADRVADAIPLPPQTAVAQESQPPASTAEQTPPAGFRRPPAAPARRVLPAGFRRPPAEPVRQPLPGGLARPPVKSASHSSTSRAAELPVKDGQYDREVVAAVMAGDPAGIAMAYDRYAAALYGYSHGILRDAAAAAGALTDTFVIAAATLGKLPEPAKLRPWLFALARNECQRRIRPDSAARDEEADAVGDAGDELADATSDETVRFPAVGRRPGAAGGAFDETVRFPAVGRRPAAAGGAFDETVRFPAVGRRPAAAGEAFDETVRFPAISLPLDPVTPFYMISQPTYGLGQLGRDQGQAELRSLIHSVLAGLRPREREVIELIFRHDLDGGDLAIALGVSQSRASNLASRARGRLEEALGALHIALTGREACPELGKLLAGWDGQLTEQTRDLVVWHIGECQICGHRGWGSMRPAVFSRLLPLAPLPPELRDQVLGVCNSTAEEAVAYRRRVIRHAESIWLARFSRAIRQASWSNIRANPGVAVAAAAVAMWMVAAVSVALLAFAGSRTAAAQAVRPSAGTGSRGPGAVVATATAPARSAPTHAAPRPSPTVTRPASYVPTPVRSVPTRASSTSPAPSRSASSSPAPSPSPSRSRTPSPSPSSASPSSTSPPAARGR